MAPLEKLKLVEELVKRRVKSGEYARAPTTEEWAAAWQIIKATPDMPEEPIARSAFAHLKLRAPVPPPPPPPPKIEPPVIASPSLVERVQRAAVATAVPLFVGKACPACKKIVAENARTCPNCGHTFTTAGGIFVAIVIGLIIGGCVFMQNR